MKKSFNYKELLGEGNPLLRYPQLLEAALDEFSQKRYEDASLNDILKNSNMSKGSLYHNFGDKFGLYLCIMDIILKKKISFFSSYMQQNLVPGDFFRTIKQVARATAEFMFIDERLHHLFNRNFESDEKLTERLIKFFPYDYNKSFDALIITAIDAGQIDKKYTPEFISKVVEIILSNAHKFIKKGQSPEDALEIIEGLIDLIQHGIETRY